MEIISQAYLGEVLNSYLSKYYKDPNSFLSTISRYEHFRKLRITKSEDRLLSSIFESGKAVGFDSHQFTNKTNNFLQADEVIRSEVLELLFRIMQDYPNIFNKHDVLFKDITIIRMKDYIELFFSKSKIKNEDERKLEKKDILEHVKPHYALDISHRDIDFDLKFQNCTFLGGLDISDSVFLSLVIESCQFGKSKDVSISNQINLNSNVNHYSINSKRTVFKGIVKIFSGQEKRSCEGDICFSNIHSCSRIELDSLICYNLNFSSAKVNKLEINSCEITGKVDFSSLIGYSILLSWSYIQNSDFGIVLDKVQVDFVNIWCSFVLGGISIERCVIDKYFGVCSSLIATKCFMSAKYKIDDSSAIEGYKAKISELFVRDGSVLLGSLETQAITIDNVYLDRSRIVSYDKLSAIDFRISDIKDTIYFGLTVNDFKSRLDQFHGDESDFYFGHKIFLKENKFGFREKTFEAFRSKLNDDVLYKALIEGEKMVSKKQFIDCEIQNISRSFKDNLDKNNLTRIDIDYSIFIGGINCSSMHVGRSVSTKGAIFIDGYIDRKTKLESNIYNQTGQKQKKEEPFSGNYTNEKNNVTKQQHTPTEIDMIAATIDFSNSIIEQDLYLQGGKLKSPNSFANDTLFEFIPLTRQVLLKSTTVRRLHLSFNKALFEDHIKKNPWNIFGLKYDFLITRSKDNYTRKKVKKADWFIDDSESYEAIQPYEQIASAFLNRGKFEESIMMQIKGKLTLAWEKKKVGELMLYSLINILARFGLPSSRAFLSLSVIFIIQLILWIPCFDWAVIPYIFGEMVPLNILDFTPPDGFIENARLHPITGIILNDIFSLLVKIISYIFFTMFVVGLSRITKKQNLGLD